jgi:hypothetical protein
MNGNDDDDRDDPVVDALLDEALGSERAPDLVTAVRARLAAGEVVNVGPERSAWSRSWTVVAALLGIGVVVALATWPRGPEPQVAGPQDPKTIPLVTVTTAAEAEALPATTRGVEVVGGNDLVLAGLRHLRALEALVVREPWNETFGLGLKMSAPRDVTYTTAAAWATIAGFTKLRRLELHGTVHAGFFGWPGVGIAPAGWSGDLDRVADAFAGLERLPLLESLTLRCMDTSDELLAKLPQLAALRHLDLSFNHGFEERGIDAILQCRGLRLLSLAGCQQLHSRLLARLHELPELEALDVSSIDGINWRHGAAELEQPGFRKVREHAERLADRIGMGPMGQALEGIGKCTKLRVLEISGGHWSAANLAELGTCRSLRELSALGGQEPNAGWVAAMPKELERLALCGDYTDDLCRTIAEHLPKLRSLSLAACYQITDRGLLAIAAIPSLRELDIKQMRGLSPRFVEALADSGIELLDLRHNDAFGKEGLRALRELPNLRVLDLGYCAQFGTDSSSITSAEAVDLLLELPALEDLSILGWAPLGDADLARLRAMPKLKQLVTDRGAETLR